MEAVREAHSRAPGVGGTALRAPRARPLRRPLLLGLACSKRWWRARAACAGVRSSSKASWRGGRATAVVLAGYYYGQGWGNTQPWSRLSPPFLSYCSGRRRAPSSPTSGDLPQESIGFRKPLREPRSVGPKGRYDVLRKRAAPRCPRRILLRRGTKTTDACEASAKLQRRRPEHCVELARPGPKALRLRATRRQSAPRHARRAA